MDEPREKCEAALRQAIRMNADAELAHTLADDALCELVEALGYGDIVKLYDEVEKWYA